MKAERTGPLPAGMLSAEVIVRPVPGLVLLTALLLPPGGLAAGLEGPAAARLSAPARAALETLLRAVETGDRAALRDRLQPGSRASAAPLLERLVPGPSEARAELRLLVAGARPLPAGGWDARLVLVGRAWPAPAEAPEADAGLVPEPGLEAVGLRARIDEEGRLVLEEGSPASVVAARVEWRLDSVPAAGEPGRLEVRSELRLEPEAPGLTSLLLDLPPGVERVELLPGGTPARARWLGEEGGSLLLELERPADSAIELRLAHEGAVTDAMRAGRATLYLPHGSLIAPWHGERFHRWDVTLDLPVELNGVSIGAGEELDAPPGRRRVRHATERLIDYPGLAVAHFRVDRDGALELWRTAEVGGDPKRLLAELRELVEFHESRVAPLPYGAFRLVEVDMEFAGAVSYASVIFMKTGIMAQAKKRFAILSHEVAHQWWGNAVQGDQHTRWISEGMANALMDLFVAHREGPEAAQDLKDAHREQTLSALGPGARPLADVRGRPADYYARGALFVHALREAVGDETFWAILRAWFEEHARPGVGTPALRATAERVAGRSLAEVFEPWLETTALPVLRLDWEPEEAGARFVVEQDEPHFLLEVPVEAMLRGGRSATRSFSVAGGRSEHRWELGERPLALRLDPTGLTPRVREDEFAAYLLGEAEACLARGESARGLALLERYEAEGHGAVPARAELLRAAALERRGESGREVVDRALEALTTDDRAVALLSKADALLAEGLAESALPLLVELAARHDDGAALHLRLGRAWLQLGRPDEAEAAFRAAHASRPGNGAARVALGLPWPERDPDGAVTLIDTEDERLDGNHPETTRLLAASDGRWGLALSGSRRIWTGRDGELEEVPDFEPVGLVDAVVVEAGSERPLVVALESGPRRGRLTVIELDEHGRGRVLARHERTPGRARGMLTDGRVVHAGFPARDGSTTWHRFRPDLRGPGSEGPDDLDGLRSLKPEGDERFEAGATTPAELPAAVLADGRVAWLTALGALRSEDGLLWEELEQEGDWRAVDLRPSGEGAAMLFTGDASRSPFPEDSLYRARLVFAGPEGLRERELPPDALQVAEAPDGSLLVLRGSAGCSGLDIRVVRLPAASDDVAEGDEPEP